MTKKTKNWLISLSAIALAGGVAVAIALPLTMCGSSTPEPIPPRIVEIKEVGTYLGETYDPATSPKIYIEKDQELKNENVLRFMEIQAGSSLANEYGCTGWTVFGTKIEGAEWGDKFVSTYNLNIDINTIPKILLIDNIEKNVQNIGWFRGKTMSSLVIPNFIENISNFAFESCTGLTGELIIPNSVISIGWRAFYDCSGLTGTLSIPASLTFIGDSAFYNCTGLTGLDLSNATSLQTINNEAFSNCSNLTGTVTIPASVTSIGKSAFFGSILTKIVVDPLNQNYVLASYKTVGTANVVIEKAKSIGPDYDYDYSYDCVGSLACGILTVWNDSSVKKIENLFAGSALTDIIISDNIIEIKSSFQWCSNLISLNLSNATSLTKFTENPFTDNPEPSFFNCPKLTGELTIPKNFSSIESLGGSGKAFNQSAFTSLIFKGSPSNDIDYEVIFAATINQDPTNYNIEVPMADHDAYLAKFPSVPQANIIGV